MLNPLIAAQIMLPDASRVSGTDMRVCTEFNKCVREYARGAQPTPEIVHDALDRARLNLRHEGIQDRQIMSGLRNGGFQAPREAIPQALRVYGAEPERRKGRSANPFDRCASLEAPQAPSFYRPAAKPRGLAELRADM